MTKKKIPRRLKDIVHIALYIAVLLLFANYESTRKANNQEQASIPVSADYLTHIKTAKTTTTTWR